MKTKHFICAALIISLICGSIAGCGAIGCGNQKDNTNVVFEDTETAVTEDGTEAVIENSTEIATEVSTEVVAESMVETQYKPTELEKNVFFDSLVYTGYNIEKHRADGMMWKYLLASKKRDKGWLSNIGYAGGSSGYETTEEGLPDISFFEENGLVCASYATYVYYNYLPNVAGIDVSKLAKPKKSYNADDWYKAAQEWIKDGYSKEVGFKASLTSSGFIQFSLDEEIPIGSIIAFCDAKNKSDECSHIVIYAGYKNNYHWVYHVGNENGPEFCAVERMNFGPDPQWPIAVITTPDFIVEQMNK